ncbi:hypothetical protein [Acinetobacter pittii]|uniref:hypothetical protein n=1 Tax=Acinetobacter pittii TaxID=48296 RepID=UPI002A061FC0|nr:hypothetical protein [Acinetobacter pittii]MDX8253686.1 hypothetical protein [Acinetobacter pittii]
MHYSPSKYEEDTLKDAIKRMYPDLIEKGIHYSISFSKINGGVIANVNWGNANSRFELKLNGSKVDWYMARDWND